MSFYRRGSPGMLIVSIAGLLLLGYSYYNISDLNAALNKKDKELFIHSRRQQTLKEQLKVVYQHTSKLEEALKNERDGHKETKQELMRKVTMFNLNITETKHEAMNRFNALDTDFKMAKANHEQMKENHISLQQTYLRLSQDHKHSSAECAEDYQKLKDRKESESISLQNQIQECYNEKIQFQESAKRYKEHYEETFAQSEQITKLARQYQEQITVYAKETRRVKNELSICRFGSLPINSSSQKELKTDSRLDAQFENLSKLLPSKNIGSLDNILKRSRSTIERFQPTESVIAPTNTVRTVEESVRRVFVGITENNRDKLQENKRNTQLDYYANQFMNRQRDIFKKDLPGERKYTNNSGEIKHHPIVDPIAVNDDERRATSAPSAVKGDARNMYGNNRYVVGDVLAKTNEEPNKNNRYLQIKDLSPRVENKEGYFKDSLSRDQHVERPIQHGESFNQLQKKNPTVESMHQNNDGVEEGQKVNRNVRPIQKIGSNEGDKIKFNPNGGENKLNGLEEARQPIVNMNQLKTPSSNSDVAIDIENVQSGKKFHQLKPPSNIEANKRLESDQIVARQNQMPIPKKHPDVARDILPSDQQNNRIANEELPDRLSHNINDNNNLEKNLSPMNKPAIHNAEHGRVKEDVTLEDDENGDQNLDHEAGQQNIHGGDGDDSDEHDSERGENGYE